jgi:hypothetical protein
MRRCGTTFHVLQYFSCFTTVGPPACGCLDVSQRPITYRVGKQITYPVGNQIIYRVGYLTHRMVADVTGGFVWNPPGLLNLSRTKQILPVHAVHTWEHRSGAEDCYRAAGARNKKAPSTRLRRESRWPRSSLDASNVLDRAIHQSSCP